ncbi:MAG: CpXC domain-containing protein [Erysipelotrichaceae bacterium]|nr:CpXC domain-containing protein [Erysipelotrichaceae bacterium]
MSHSNEITYTCPYCGKQFPITIYDTVNVREDPDLRERCLSGDIFRHSCPHCHKDFMVQNPMLYEDPDKHFVLYVSQNDPGNTFKEAGEALKKKGYRLRRVSTIKEFTEKISVFEDGMNDIAVELAKYDSFIEFINNRKGKPEDITSIDYQYTHDDVMKINIRTGDKGMSFLIPVSGIQEEMEENKQLYQIDDASFPCINQDWIISLFSTPEGKA